MPFIIKAIQKDSVGYLRYEWVTNSWIFDLETANIFQDNEEKRAYDGVEKAFNSNYNVCFQRIESKIERQYV